jgi:RNA polymerase sigma factor for flagellar operon FliA
MAVQLQDIHGAWTEFSISKSLKDKHRLLMNYIWLVKYVIQSMNLPNNTLLSDEDFVNIGILGLHEAIERFELERGVKFESYAIPRIKGTIQDELRRLDWLSRTARKKAHEFIAAGDTLRSQQGREVTAEEIRMKLNVTPDEYQSYLEAVAASKASLFMSESSMLSIDDEDIDTLGELPDTSQENFLTKMENEERLAFITGYLKDLPDRKRLVVTLYYYENLTFKEIGKVLNVSESRICQIHTEVISGLRVKLNEFDNA